MKQQLYVIYDTVACKCGPIRECENDGVAFRWLSTVLAQNAGPGFKPDDFELYHVGETDSHTMIINPFPPREVTINLELIDQEKEIESV
jgi:hypothetical protein